MVTPDLAALVAGVEKLGQSYSPSDPLFQQLVETSVTMAETFLEGMPGDQSGDEYLMALRNLQVVAELGTLQFD